MKGVLERDVSKKWIKAYLKEHPDEYAFRIHDCPWGRKDFDGFLMTRDFVWAVEFKVDRRKTYAYTLDEVPTHQVSALKEFANGKNRRSKVIVYHAPTDSWHEFEVSREEEKAYKGERDVTRPCKVHKSAVCAICPKG